MDERLLSKTYWLFLAGSDEKRSVQLQAKKCSVDAFWNHSILFLKFQDKMQISFRLFLSASSGFSSFYAKRNAQKGYLLGLKNKYIDRSYMQATTAQDFLKTIHEMGVNSHADDFRRLWMAVQSYLNVLRQIQDALIKLESF